MHASRSPLLDNRPCGTDVLDVDAPWARVTPGEAQRLLSNLSIRWWIAGGWALDPEGGHEHSDIDVAVLRSEHEAIRRDLKGWDLQVAHEGALRPWHGGTVALPANAVWARPTSEDPWHIDFKIELVDGDDWVYRRDPGIRRPVAEIGVLVDGIPFLAPELARLYERRST
jgi:Aminoglycoside-2''-adenylyltransferase